MRARAGRKVGLLRPLCVLPAAVLLASCAAHPAPAPSPAMQFPPAPAQKIGTEALPAVEPPAPLVHQGAPATARTVAPGAPSVAVSPGGDVTLNFADADIREVVRAVVGDILGLNYYVDAKVQGTVTVQTTRPLPRAAVLPTLERVLRASGAALVEDNGLVRVMPLEAAAKGAPAQAAVPGNAIRILPLQYVTADQLQKVIQPFIPLGASLQADSTHNVLILSGSREDMDSLANLIRSFDTDWLARMSFALVPLRNGTADAISSQMQAIIVSASGGDTTGEALRLVPVPQLEAILVISAQPRYLDWAQQQIGLLDAASADSAQRTYIYHVQYGRASDLADVLTRIFGSGAPSASTKPALSSTSYLEPSSMMAPLTTAFGQAGAQSTGAAPTAGLGAATPGTPLAQGAATPAPAPGAASTGTARAARPGRVIRAAGSAGHAGTRDGGGRGGAAHRHRRAQQRHRHRRDAAPVPPHRRGAEAARREADAGRDRGDDRRGHAQRPAAIRAAMVLPPAQQQRGLQQHRHIDARPDISRAFPIPSCCRMRT